VNQLGVLGSRHTLVAQMNGTYAPGQGGVHGVDAQRHIVSVAMAPLLSYRHIDIYFFFLFHFVGFVAFFWADANGRVHL